MGARLIRHLLHKRHDLSTSLRSAQRQRFVATSTAARSEPPTIGRLTPPHTRAWGLWASAGAGAAAAAYLFGSRADSDAHQNGWPLSGGAAPPVLPGALGDGAVVATTSGSQHLSGVTQPSWVTEFAASQSLQVMSTQTLRSHMHPLISEDHMFSAFVDGGLVTDLACFYDRQQQRFTSIIALGPRTCGYKRITHGGMTAAIVDESFGGLLLALRQAGALPFWGPAFTASLEVAYKAKIPGGATVLCTCEVDRIEGRKVYMRARVSDGPDGKTYATATALFVSPRLRRLLKDGVVYIWEGVFGRTTR